MIHFPTMVKAQKAMWVQRLITKDAASWKAYPKWLCEPMEIDDFIKCSFASKNLPSNFPVFYHQVFFSWAELQDVDIQTVWDIRRQFLWFNKNILINNNYAWTQYIEWYKAGIRLVHDILLISGQFKSINELENKYNIRIDIMKYNSLKDSMPTAWRKLLKSQSVANNAISSEESCYVWLNKAQKPIENICNKDVYWQLVKPFIVEPICKIKWNNIFNFEDNMWKTIFTLPFKYVTETSLQSFQYKILFRIYPCNAYVSIWNNEVSPLCSNCQILDDLVHYFAQCLMVLPFWNSFTNWWNFSLNDQLSLTDADIIFGKTNDGVNLAGINFCLLHAKKFIARQKFLKKDVFFYSYQVELKFKLEVEKYICTRNNKLILFELKYGAIYDSL